MTPGRLVVLGSLGMIASAAVVYSVTTPGGGTAAPPSASSSANEAPTPTRAPAPTSEAPRASVVAPSPPSIPSVIKLTPITSAQPDERVTEKTLLDMLAASAAARTPRMLPVSKSKIARLKEGRSLSDVATLRFGGCYLLVAASDGVATLHLTLALRDPPAGLDGKLLDQSIPAPLAFLPEGTCFKWTLSPQVAVRFIVEAQVGGGLVAAQLFEEKRGAKPGGERFNAPRAP